MSRLKLKDTLTFGKYKGKAIEDVLDTDPQYLVWLNENTEHKLTTKIYNEAKLYSRDSWEDYDEGDYEAWKD